MSETPTARELLDTTAVPGDEPWCELAARVDAVLAYCQFVREKRSGVVVASKIERILDGGKP
jgi:hypothetical protein